MPATLMPSFLVTPAKAMGSSAPAALLSIPRTRPIRDSSFLVYWYPQPAKKMVSPLFGILRSFAHLAPAAFDSPSTLFFDVMLSARKLSPGGISSLDFLLISTLFKRVVEA